jgi:hypothetical protein
MARLIRGAFAFATLATLCLSAGAEPITTFLASTAFTTAAGAAISYGAIISAVVTVASVASSVYGSMQAKKQARRAAERKFQQDVANLQDRTTSIIAGDDAWPIVYGQPAPIGGSIKAVITSGDKAQFKHIVMVLAAHECESVDDVLIDGESLQLNEYGTSQNPSYQLEYGIPRDITYAFEVKAYPVYNSEDQQTDTIYAALVNTSADGQFYSPQIVSIKNGNGANVSLTLGNRLSVPGQVGNVGFVLLGSQAQLGLTGNVTIRVDGPGSAVHVSKHLCRGGVDFADPILMGAQPALWTENHKLTGFTYLVITINLLLERFQGGLPAFTAKVKGKRCFDPRTGAVAYTRNPAICLADFIRSEAGYMALPEQIDDNALIAAANACDQVAYGPEAWADAPTFGNDVRLYTCDGMFRTDQDRDTTRQQIEDSMAGYSLESGGVWRILAGAWTTPVMALTDADLLGPVSVVQTCNPGTQRYNGARGSYVNQARNGVTEDYTPYQNAVFRAADAKDKFLDLALTFTASHARTHQIARTLVEQSRGGFILQINPKMSAWHLQPGDRITLSSLLYGFTNKPFRIQEWTYSATSPLTFQVIEDEASFYDLADESKADPAPNTNLPSPLIVPDAPFDLAVRSGPDELVLQGSTAVVRVRVSWGQSNSPAVRMGGSVRVQYRTVVPVGEWQTMDLPGEAVETYILGLAVRDEYQVRVRFQTPYVSSNWVTVTHTVTGKSEFPEDVAGLTLSMTPTGVLATWQQPAGLDLLDWNTTSVRIGPTWELATEVFSGKATSAALGWLQAGTARVWASHSSTTNEWSVPVSATIEILAPLQPLVTGAVWRNEIDLAWQDCATSQPISFYLVSRGPTLADSVEIARPTDRRLTHTEVPGNYLYWVRAVDAGGNAGAPGYVQLTVLPGIDEALEELQEGLDEQIEELKQVDATTGQAIANEVQERVTAIAAEAQARTTAISAEASARATALNTEAQTRSQQITQVTNSITAESAARIAALAQEVTDRHAAVLAEATTRADAIIAEANTRAAALLAETNNRTAAITAEATTRQQADEALSSQITTLNASLGATNAAVQTEATARATGDAAEATARQQLATQLLAADATLTAAIANEASTRSTADAAEARTRESLTAALLGTKDIAADISYVDGPSLNLSFTAPSYRTWEPLTLTQLGSGLIAEERQARITSDAAEVSARETLQAQMTGGYTGSDLSQVVSGLIFQERSARATSDEALAQQITLISAGVGEQFDPAKIWYFDSGLEGWAGNGAPTAAAGWLRPADHATDPYVTSPTGIASNGTTYSQVRLRIRKVGAPAWAGTIFWRAAADAGFVAGRSIAMTEPTYDAAGIGMVTVNPGWDVAIDQVRIDLSTAQTATDYFEIDWLAIGRPSPGASNAALSAEIAARANADSAEVTARENLATQLRGGYTGNDIAALSSGLLASERNARVSADAAEVTARQQLAATVATNKTNSDAALLAEQTVRASADAAEVTAREALAATVANNLATVNAALTAEQTARATADSAEVTAREALQTQIRGAYTGTDVGAVTSGLIYSERQARITADNAEITARQALATTVTNNKSAADAAMLSEQTLRATADTANANAITALQTTVTNNATSGAAALQTEANARATADSAEATQRQGLSVALTGVPAMSGSLDTVIGPSVDVSFVGKQFKAWEKPTGPTLASGLLFEERVARITADEAEVTARQQLAATVIGNKTTTDAAILAEQTARATADTANANAITALASTVNSTTDGLPSRATNTALNALTTRVSSAEGTLSSHGTAITNLNSSLELGRADSQASLTADESMANVAAWRSHYNQDLAPRFVTVNDGKVGTTVCRSQAGGGTFWNYSKSKVVIDPTRTYRISAWFRRVGANGAHYWNWWRNNTGAYGNASIPLASLTENTWVLLSLQQLGSAFGDTSVSPGFALNHISGTTGYTEIQGFRFEDVTDSLRLTGMETSKANASAVTALTTRVTAAEGTITSQATSLTNLTATVNGHTASISTNASAIASLDGTVKATWRLNVDANGRTAGMILDNNGTTSSLVMLVDKFAVAQPGAGGTVKYPFTIGNIDGVSSIGIDGNMYIDGSIKARSLDVEQLSATISKLNYVYAGQISINGNMAGNDWGYIRSRNKWRDGEWGWILAQHPNGSMFVDFNLAGCGLVMHHEANNFAQFHLWGPGFNLNHNGLTINQIDVIGALNIRGRSITTPTARHESGPSAGITHWVPDNNGQWVTTYVTASSFIPPGAGGGGGGFLQIQIDGNAHWLGGGLPGSTVSGSVVVDLAPGSHWITAVGAFGGSNTSIFALSCQR